MFALCSLQAFFVGRAPKKLVTAAPQLIDSEFDSVSGSGLFPGYNIAGILIVPVVVSPCVVFVKVIVTLC